MPLESFLKIAGLSYVERVINLTLKDVNKIAHKVFNGGADGTRTRDLRLDRPAF